MSSPPSAQLRTGRGDPYAVTPMIRGGANGLLSHRAAQQPFGVMGPRVRGDDARECGHSLAFSRRDAPEV